MEATPQSWNVLFVCTGNTCRSPMAEALARQLLAERLNVPVEQLAERGVKISSAGVSTFGGSPASEPAVQLLADQGIDLSRHRSQPLTLDLIQDADAIFTMTRRHGDAVRQILPRAEAKTHPLDPEADIEDPVGGGPELYRSIAEQIRTALRRRIEQRYGGKS